MRAYARRCAASTMPSRSSQRKRRARGKDGATRVRRVAFHFSSDRRTRRRCGRPASSLGVGRLLLVFGAFGGFFANRGCRRRRGLRRSRERACAARARRARCARSLCRDRRDRRPVRSPACACSSVNNSTATASGFWTSLRAKNPSTSVARRCPAHGSPIRCRSRRGAYDVRGRRRGRGRGG